MTQLEVPQLEHNSRSSNVSPCMLPFTGGYFTSRQTAGIKLPPLVDPRLSDCQESPRALVLRTLRR